MATYTDLLIENDEIATDAAGIPLQIYDRDVIAQDIRHMLRESGLLEQLIAERSAEIKRLILKNIRSLIESDLRVVPGSCKANFANPNELILLADSEFGAIETKALL